MDRSLFYICIQIILTGLVQKCVTQDASSTESTSTTSISTLSPGTDDAIWNPRSTEKIIITCDEGYQIAAKIKECNIDGTKQEYATISSGKVDETIMLVYKISNTPSYLFNTNKLTASFNGTDASNLTVVFTRVGEPPISTTTELTTSTVYIPTPSVNDSDELTVHLSGKNPIDYKNTETLSSLKNMISEIAQEYCEVQLFELVDPITSDNVKIKEILPCASYYSECDFCAEIRFSVPIHIKEESSSTWSGYQLNSEHLSIMWDRYASKYLKDGITICGEEPISSWINGQIILFSSCTVVILSLLLVMRHFAIKSEKRIERRNRLKSKSSINSYNENPNETALHPHYLQEIPALFDNTFPMYNPEKGHINTAFESYRDDFENDNEPIKLENIEKEESGA